MSPGGRRERLALAENAWAPRERSRSFCGPAGDRSASTSHVELAEVGDGERRAGTFGGLRGQVKELPVQRDPALRLSEGEESHRTCLSREGDHCNAVAPNGGFDVTGLAASYPAVSRSWPTTEALAA